MDDNDGPKRVGLFIDEAQCEADEKCKDDSSDDAPAFKETHT